MPRAKKTPLSLTATTTPASPQLLIPANLEEIYKIFVLWKARPLAKDSPQNALEFATKYNLTPAHLKDFTLRPEYQDDLLLASLDWAKSKTPELLHLVYAEVKSSKDVQDLERFMNLVHDLKKKKEGSNQQFNFFNLPPDAYNAILQREVRLIEEGGTEPLA